MFENPRRGRQARNFTTNAPKILDLKSSSEQIFSRKLPLGAPEIYILELKDFQEQIQQSDITLTELLRKYNAMTTMIQNSWRAFQPYLMGL